MKPNMSVGLRCRLTQPTKNEQGIDGRLINLCFSRLGWRMKPNMSVGLRCRLTQPTKNEQGIDGRLINLCFSN